MLIFSAPFHSNSFNRLFFKLISSYSTTTSTVLVLSNVKGMSVYVLIALSVLNITTFALEIQYHTSCRSYKTKFNNVKQHKHTCCTQKCTHKNGCFILTLVYISFEAFQNNFAFWNNYISWTFIPFAIFIRSLLALLPLRLFPFLLYIHQIDSLH